MVSEKIQGIPCVESKSENKIYFHFTQLPLMEWEMWLPLISYSLLTVMMWLQFKLSSGAWGLELPDEWMFPAETLGASSYLGTIMSDGHHGWLLLDFYLFHFGFAEFLIFMCKKWAVRGKCRTKFSQFRQFEFAQQICTQTRLIEDNYYMHTLD